MLRPTLACLCLCAFVGWTVGLGSSWYPFFARRRLEPIDSRITEQEPSPWQRRQQFILDLLLQVHKPLLHDELIQMGSRLSEDPDKYMGSFKDVEDFLASVRQDRVPRPFSIFSQLDEKMPQLLLGLYRFLVQARNWSAFQRNACYARIHFHPVLFVNALQMAVSDREDTKDLSMPAMYEILPQLYFEKEVILAAQEIAWHQLTPVRLVTPKRRWKDILLGISSVSLAGDGEPMSADPWVIDNGRERAYLVLDLGLNSQWNMMINRHILSLEEEKQRPQRNQIIDGDRMVAFRGPQDEVKYRLQLEQQPGSSQLFLFSLHQFMAALAMEDLATGQISKDLIDPPLISTGGIPYKGTSLNIQAVERILDVTIQELKGQIDQVLNGNWNLPETEFVIAKIIGSNYLNTCRHLSLAINGHQRGQPSMLDSSTVNLRDPIYRFLLKRLSQLIPRPDKKDEQDGGLLTPQIISLKVGNLSTFEDVFDTDLINLIDQQLLQSQRNNLQFLRRHLVARQRRLNHNHFDISLDISSPADITTHLRIYLSGGGHRLFLHSASHTLKTGVNEVQLHFPSAAPSLTLSDLYGADYPKTQEYSSVGLPPHLLLPRGTVEGLRLQLIAELTSGSGCGQEMGGESGSVLAKAEREVLIFHQPGPNY